mmetsp:Transcript_25647/g.74144  ORF Transcript_25647/g.74144 Transcript_25647/m.74144 type:complete len:531 (-) Transcript_25647:120-1712(-)
MLLSGVADGIFLAALQAGGVDGRISVTVPGRLSLDDIIGHRHRYRGAQALLQQQRQRPSLDTSGIAKKHDWMGQEGEADVLGSTEPSDGGTRHPFWHFEPQHLSKYQVYITCVVLFVAGILCSAGGIGGGGIYVTVLMVAGRMNVTDAVPLSKAIVFFGSISSLILNMRKSLSASSTSNSLIDYNICRLVVPASLLGTFLGVFLNRHLPGSIILIVLSLILVFITASVGRTTWCQFKEEREAANFEAKAVEHPASSPPAEAPGSAPGAGAGAEVSEMKPMSEKLRNRVGFVDSALGIIMLTLVIGFGTFRFHSGECQDASEDSRSEVCNHPSLFWLGNGTLESWMTHGGDAIRVFSFVFPLLFCLAVSLWNTFRVVKWEGWTVIEATSYSIMAIVTGCLAGLVGIGGGLIFSPFFLVMGVEPSVAVASSSTCVIFTSSSTSLQYLLTDRIIISLTVVYGVVNLLASYAGTSLVHMLHDRFSARKSYISLIVGMGVLISTVLAVVKLGTKLAAQHPEVKTGPKLASLVDFW